jgi:hypothetical protein
MLLGGKLTKDRKVPFRIVIVHLQVAMQTLIIVQIADMPCHYCLCFLLLLHK